MLHLDDKIDPYDDTLNNKSEKEKKKWAYKVYKQCEKNGIDFDEPAMFLCGENYRKYLMKVFKRSFCPIANLSFGKNFKVV